MTQNKIRGPLVSLAAVAALGGGLWWLNVAQTPEAAPPRPVVESATVAPPPVARPSPPPVVRPAAFPARASYEGTIPTKAGPLTLQITVEGQTATAYACDNLAVETWLRGSARAGALMLASDDGASRLEGHLRGTSVVGTLRIGTKSWDFTAAESVNPQ